MAQTAGKRGKLVHWERAAAVRYSIVERHRGAIPARRRGGSIAALYPAKGAWRERLPLALVFEGPVVQQAPAIDREIARLEIRTS
jgi:hypothetical protein